MKNYSESPFLSSAQMSRQGISQADLEGTQAFARTVLNPKIENPDPVAMVIIEHRGGALTREEMAEQVSLYASRYGSIYSKRMVGTMREKNAAFKVKLFCEAMAGVEPGKWDDIRGIWEESYELSEMLSRINNLLYTEALKVIHCKIASYHSCVKVQTLLDYC